MSDTQWPRFIVFQQEHERAAHQYAGSVHAPDAEMALLNARDVFVRRPACVSLWVVSALAVFTKTAEELAANALAGEALQAETSERQTYIVFQKAAHKGTFSYTGKVNATTPDQALAVAFETFAQRAALAWWVFPEQAVTRSTPEDIEALFQPAAGKTFRDQAFYHTVAAMQQIRKQLQDNMADES